MPVVLNLSYKEATYLEALLEAHRSAGVDAMELRTIHAKVSNASFPRRGDYA